MAYLEATVPYFAAKSNGDANGFLVFGEISVMVFLLFWGITALIVAFDEKKKWNLILLLREMIECFFAEVDSLFPQIHAALLKMIVKH